MKVKKALSGEGPVEKLLTYSLLNQGSPVTGAHTRGRQAVSCVGRVPG